MGADEEFMRLAIEKARDGVRGGQTPFGACIVRDGQVVACEHNEVWASGDITAHAEMVAIRRACEVLGTIDLSGCVIYSSCEPCPMCFSACHWARIGRIVYGAAISDAREAGFSELSISNEQMAKLGGSGLEIVAGCMAAEARELFDLWLSQANRRVY